MIRTDVGVFDEVRVTTDAWLSYVPRGSVGVVLAELHELYLVWFEFGRLHGVQYAFFDYVADGESYPTSGGGWFLGADEVERA